MQQSNVLRVWLLKQINAKQMDESDAIQKQTKRKIKSDQRTNFANWLGRDQELDHTSRMHPKVEIKNEFNNSQPPPGPTIVIDQYEILTKSFVHQDKCSKVKLFETLMKSFIYLQYIYAARDSLYQILALPIPRATFPPGWKCSTSQIKMCFRAVLLVNLYLYYEFLLSSSKLL